MKEFTKLAHDYHMPEEIIYLIIKRLTNILDGQDAIVLQQWLNERPENQKIFNEVSDIWLASSGNPNDEYNAFEALKKVQSRLNLTSPAEEEPKKKNLFISIFKYAALILLMVSIGGISYFLGKSKKISTGIELTEISAPMGSRTKVNLPDGTKVWLNGGSTLRFSNQFNKSDRSVSLQGEGYFDVMHNKNLPFLVNTGEIRIKVLGTAFNVKAYPDDGSIETTLERGSLAIEKFTTGGNTIPQTVLEPNQRATFIRKEGSILLSEIDQRVTENVAMGPKETLKEKLLVSKQIDTKIFTSWKDSKLVFRNETFEGLKLKLERWYGVDIKIEDEEIKNYHFNGTFEKETIQDALKIIQFTLPIKYNVKHDHVTISVDK